MRAVHNESIAMLWEVGAYVSERLSKAAWGDGVVRMLAEYIHTKSPKAKGWSYRTIYKMVQFYDTYSSEEFRNVVCHYGMQNFLSVTGKNMLSMNDSAIVPIETAQLQGSEFVPIESAQIPSVLFAKEITSDWETKTKVISKYKKNEAYRSFSACKMTYTPKTHSYQICQQWLCFMTVES